MIQVKRRGTFEAMQLERDNLRLAADWIGEDDCVCLENGLLLHRHIEVKFGDWLVKDTGVQAFSREKFQMRYEIVSLGGKTSCLVCGNISACEC